MQKLPGLMLRLVALVGVVAVLVSCATQALPRDSGVTSVPTESSALPSSPEVASSPVESPTVSDTVVAQSAYPARVLECVPPRGRKNPSRELAIEMLKVERDEVRLDELVLSQEVPEDVFERQDEFRAVLNAVETLDEDFDLAWIAGYQETWTVEALWKGEPPVRLADLAAVLPGWIRLVNRGGARFSLVDMHDAINRFDDVGARKEFGVHMLGASNDGMGVVISVGLDASDADIEAAHQAIDHCLARASRTNGDDDLTEPVEPTTSLVIREEPIVFLGPANPVGPPDPAPIR